MRCANTIVAAARKSVGVPFRLHGRDPATGLDCIGLIVHVLECAGHETVKELAPRRYSVRGGNIARFGEVLEMAGLRTVRKQTAGDLILAQAGVAQFHMMIATGEGHVHAHAGLGRVVEMPGPSPWPVLSRWRW